MSLELEPGAEVLMAHLSDGAVSFMVEGTVPAGLTHVDVEDVLWRMDVPGWAGTDPSWQVYAADESEDRPLHIWTHLWALSTEQRVEFVGLLRAHLEANGFSGTLKVVDGDGL